MKEKIYTQEELDDAVKQATCEAYERTKHENHAIIAKYNTLRRLLKDLSSVFDEDDS